MYDIIIVGGGPAGLTSAIYALRAGKNVLVIEKGGFGGQIAFSPKVENIPGFKEISGSEFADQLTEQAMNLGADVELENVVTIEKQDDIFKVSTEEGSTYEACPNVGKPNAYVLTKVNDSLFTERFMNLLTN